MEKLRLEVSTHPAISVFFSPCICTVCGLVVSTQLPCLATETTPHVTVALKSAVVTVKLDSSPSSLRPMAFRRTTTARSQAKSQVAKTQSTPLQALKPAASSKTTRYALTAPAIGQNRSRSEAVPSAFASAANDATPTKKWNVAADERIIMTALPESNASDESSAPVENEVAVQTIAPAAQSAVRYSAATPETPAREIGDANEGEPLTGTIVIEKKPLETAVQTTTVATPDKPGTDVSTPASSDVTGSAVTADSKSAQTSRLFAPSIAYEGGTIIAEGTDEEPVRLEGTDTRIIARKVRLDTVNQSVRAEGKVRVERQVKATRFSTFNPGRSGGKKQTEVVTETLQGENFEYNYGTRQGKLDATRVRLANFNISAEEIIINGTKYIAHNVVIRPGGLSDEEIKIYGTPPFHINANTVIVDTSKAAPSDSNTSSDTSDDLQPAGAATAQTQVKGAALYFKNFRLFPIPSSILGRSFGGPREQETYQLTPRVSFNSADGLLVTVGLKYPFSTTDPNRLKLNTDIGVSTRVGFRGGATLSSKNKLGRFSIGARLNDVISSQLTNRIELDRLPEASYQPPRLSLLALPGGRRAGLIFDFSAGDYRERFTTGGSKVSSSRLQGQVRFTTRMGKPTGPYVDLLARAASYSNHPESLSTAGFEVGYIGSLGSRISGQFSFGATKVNGSTPFEFDKVSIKKELRTTFDILLTPRYIIPIDLRYDLDRKQLRDKTFGILRNYKTFAYGLTYQASRHELQFQVRQGF